MAQLYTMRQAAAYLSISYCTFKRYNQQKLVRSTLLPSADGAKPIVRFTAKDLDKFIEEFNQGEVGETGWQNKKQRPETDASVKIVRTSGS